MSGSKKRTPLGDLIKAGLVQPPFRIVHEHHGQLLSGEVAEGGDIRVGSESYATLSAAAVAAIGSARKGRKVEAINGWQLWKKKSEDGRRRSIDTLRRRLGEAQSNG